MRIRIVFALAAGILVLGATAGMAQRAPDVRLDTANPPFSGSMSSPRISVAGSSVYVVWSENRAAPDDTDIYFNRSLDGGRTWLAVDVRVDDRPAGVRSVGPVIASSGDHVFVAWADRELFGMDSLWFTRSLDSGTSWSPSIRIDVGLDVGSTYLAIANDGDVVHLVWHEWTSPASIQYAMSPMAGNPGTWSPPMPISGPWHALWPVIACCGPNVYVAWFDDEGTSGRHVRFNRTTAGGTGGGFFTTPVAIEHPPAILTGTPVPAIACSGDAVYVTWVDGRNNPGGIGPHDSDVYFQKSADAGSTFLASDVRVDRAQAPGFGNAHDPVIAAASSGVVYVGWRDIRNSSSGLYFTASQDGGTTWPASEVRLDVSSPSGTYASSLKLAAEGATVAAAWRASFGGGNAYQVYSRASFDGGITWDLAEVKLNTGGSGNTSAPDLAIETVTKFHVTWSDIRPPAPGEPPNWDVYTNVWERGLTVANGPSSSSFSLDVTMDPLLPYVGAASFDHVPGVVLTNQRTVPLNYDSLAMISLDPAFASVFSGFGGVVDAAGHAAPAILYPPGIPSGSAFYVAFVTLDPTAPDGVRTVTRAVRVTVP